MSKWHAFLVHLPSTELSTPLQWNVTLELHNHQLKLVFIRYLAELPPSVLNLFAFLSYQGTKSLLYEVYTYPGMYFLLIVWLMATGARQSLI